MTAETLCYSSTRSIPLKLNWQSSRLLIGRLLVRVQSGEQTRRSQAYGSDLSCFVTILSPLYWATSGLPVTVQRGRRVHGHRGGSRGSLDNMRFRSPRGGCGHRVR